MCMTRSQAGGLFWRKLDEFGQRSCDGNSLAPGQMLFIHPKEMPRQHIKDFDQHLRGRLTSKGFALDPYADDSDQGCKYAK